MKILVVGLGSMGKRRIRNLHAHEVEEIRGYDPRLDRCEEVANLYNVETSNNWDDAKNWETDAWVISTPPLTHSAYAVEGLEAGKYIFTEADLPDENIAEIIRLPDQNKLVAVPSCTMLFYPGPKTVMDVIAKGYLGAPRLFNYHSGQHLADWHPWEDYTDFYASKRKTGAAREIVPFELVWMTHVLGPVEKVTCLHGKAGTLSSDIDDYYALTLKFSSGVAGTLLVDAVSRPDVRSFRLSCDRGVLEWNQTDKIVRTRTKESSDWEVIQLETGHVEKNYINPEEPYINEMGCFLSAISGEANYPYSFEKDEQVLAILEQAESSMGLSS